MALSVRYYTDADFTEWSLRMWGRKAHEWSSHFMSKIERRNNTPSTLPWLTEFENYCFSLGGHGGLINWIVSSNPTWSGTLDRMHCWSYIWFVSNFLLNNCMIIVFLYFKAYVLLVSKKKGVVNYCIWLMKALLQAYNVYFVYHSGALTIIVFCK